MPFTLVRQPKSLKTTQAEVLVEVEKAIKKLAEDSKKKLEADVATWQQRPTFKYKVVVNKNRWQFTMYVDKRQKMGKIYTWIDEGVGEYGGKKHLPDITVKKAKYLRFTVPHQPLSLPNPAVPGIPSSETPHGMRKVSVHHPGIYPRNFTKTLMDWLYTKKPGAFRSVVEAALKRAYRKMSRRK